MRQAREKSLCRHFGRPMSSSGRLSVEMMMMRRTMKRHAFITQRVRQKHTIEPLSFHQRKSQVIGGKFIAIKQAQIKLPTTTGTS